MNVQEIMAGGGCLIVLMTLVQIAPVEINPWSSVRKALSAVGRALGKVFNGAVIEKLDKMEAMQSETRKQLDEHIRVDDERNADLHRTYILRFSMELRRGMQHTDEDFNEVLYNIKCYEQYCRDHPEYENNRAVLAIQSIERVYSERLEMHDIGNG